MIIEKREKRQVFVKTSTVRGRTKVEYPEKAATLGKALAKLLLKHVGVITGYYPCGRFAKWAVSEGGFMSTHYIMYPKH